MPHVVMGRWKPGLGGRFVRNFFKRLEKRRWHWGADLLWVLQCGWIVWLRGVQYTSKNMCRYFRILVFFLNLEWCSLHGLTIKATFLEDRSLPENYCPLSLASLGWRLAAQGSGLLESADVIRVLWEATLMHISGGWRELAKEDGGDG